MIVLRFIGAGNACTSFYRNPTRPLISDCLSYYLLADPLLGPLEFRQACISPIGKSANGITNAPGILLPQEIEIR